MELFSYFLGAGCIAFFVMQAIRFRHIAPSAGFTIRPLSDDTNPAQ